MPRKLSPSWLNWLCRTPGRRAGSWRENLSLVKPCFLFAWKTCGSSKPGVPQSLEDAQRSGLVITFYQQKKVKCKFPGCTAALRGCPAVCSNHLSVALPLS